MLSIFFKNTKFESFSNLLIEFQEICSKSPLTNSIDIVNNLLVFFLIFEKLKMNI